MAAFGSLSDISFSTDQDAKNLFGRSAYIVEGIKKLLPIQSMDSYKAKIEFDDELVEGNFIHFMASNSISVGGFNLFDDKVGLTDGLFEVTLVKKPESIAGLNKIIQSLTSGESSDMVIQRQAKKINITTEKDVSWSLDGDFGGRSKEATIEVVNTRINIRTGLSN